MKNIRADPAMIYLDNNATTRVLESVEEAMRPFLTERFANPSSAIGQFLGLDRVIASEKAKIAELLGADGREQLFITSGATESNNLAIAGAAKANPERRHLVVSATEHPSVLEVAGNLERTGYQVTIVAVDRDGLIDPDRVVSSLRPNTLLVSLMLANNETGVLQPVQEVAERVKGADPSVVVHSDATQAAGKLAIDLGMELNAVDLLSFSAHKFHGPKGVGGLFVREARQVGPLFYGGAQQLGLRPGTENPAAVVGMGAALSAVSVRREEYRATAKLRDAAERQLLAACPRAFSLGGRAVRLPTTLCVCLPGFDADHLIDQMAARGFAISTGSACAHGARKPSHVARAMGLSHDEAESCLRISLSLETTARDMEAFVAALIPLLRSAESLATKAVV